MPDKRILTLPVVYILVFGQMSGLVAQQPKFAMTIDNIMRGPGLYGYEPTAIRWSGDSQEIYFQWKQASDPIDHPLDTYVVHRDGSGLHKLTDDEARLAPPPSGSRTRDRKREVYSLDGDIFIYDYSTGKRTQLTKTEDNESNPAFTQDQQHVAFTRGGNLYVMALDSGMLEQMTDIVAPGATPPTAPEGFGGGGRGGRGGPRATAASEKKGTDSQEFLKKQEQELIDVVRERTKLREENEAKRKREHPRKPFQLQPRQSAARLELCPDQKCVVALINETPNGAKPQNVPTYVNESAYTEDIVGRSDVGDLQNKNRMAVLDVESGEAKWVEPDVHGREVQLQSPLWNDAGTEAVMVARATDNKDRWIFALDPATGKTRVLFTEHDDAWLNGPGAQTLGWLKHSNEIYFQSERTGYSQLYKVSFDGGEPKELTSGKFEVSSVDLSNDGSKFYLTTSEVGPAERHFYSVSVDGGAREKITGEVGWHHVTLSPDEKFMADVYSYTNKPPELFVADNRPNAPEKKLTSSPAPDFWGVQVDRSPYRAGPVARRLYDSRAFLQTRELPQGRTRRRLRPRRGLRAERI